MIHVALTLLATGASPSIAFVDSRPTTFRYSYDFYLNPGSASKPDSASFPVPISDPGMVIVDVKSDVVADMPDRKGPKLPFAQRAEVSLMSPAKKSVMSGHYADGSFARTFAVVKDLSSAYDPSWKGKAPPEGGWGEPGNPYWRCFSLWLMSYHGPGAIRGTAKITAPAYGYRRAAWSFTDRPKSWPGNLARFTTLNKPGYYVVSANYSFKSPGIGNPLPLGNTLTVRIGQDGPSREKSRAGHNVIVVRVASELEKPVNLAASAKPATPMPNYSGSISIKRYPLEAEKLLPNGAVFQNAGG